MKKLMFFLHIFIGVGALFGGAGAILNPDGPMGISTEVLEGSPFDNFLIPGLVLFGFIGVVNILAGISCRKGSERSGYFSGVMGGGLMVWILLQCLILGDVVFLHILYFVLGLIQAILGLMELSRKRQFPFSILR